MSNTSGKIADVKNGIDIKRDRLEKEALELVGAVRRKMDELEKRIGRAVEDLPSLGKVPFGYEDAAVGEILSLHTKLSGLNGLGVATTALSGLLEALAADEADRAKAVTAKKPAAAPAGEVKLPDLGGDASEPEETGGKKASKK